MISKFNREREKLRLSFTKWNWKNDFNFISIILIWVHWHYSCCVFEMWIVTLWVQSCFCLQWELSVCCIGFVFNFFDDFILTCYKNKWFTKQITTQNFNALHISKNGCPDSESWVKNKKTVGRHAQMLLENSCCLL